MNKQHLPKILLLFVVIIGVANAFATQFFLYWRLPWLDMLMHFLGGIWIGLVVLWVYYLSGKFKNIPENRRCVSYVYGLAAIVTMVTSVFWELFEFSLDVKVAFNEFNGFYDTASDIIIAVFGALVAARYFVCKSYYKEHEHNSLDN